MSFTYPASSCPSPSVSITSPLLAACSATVTTAPTLAPLNNTFIATQLNQIFAALAGACLYGGNGLGISDGLVLSAITGLNAQISTGHAYMGGVVELPSAVSITLSDNTTLGFVWLIQSANGQPPTPYDSGDSTTLPSGWVGTYIGNYTTSAGVITKIDFTSVCYINGGRLARTTGDRCGPTDLPDVSVRVQTTTQSGAFEWNGANHQPVGTISYTANVAATMALNANDKGVFALTPTGGNQTVNLPASPILGDSLIIAVPATASHNVLLTDSTGMRATATLPPGSSTPPMFALPGPAGAPVYPASVTPVIQSGSATVSAKTTGKTTTSTTLTYSFTSADAFVAVSVHWDNNVATVTSVTFDGAAMTPSPTMEIVSPSALVQTQQFYLAGAAVGTFNVVITLDHASNIGSTAVSVHNAAGTIGSHAGANSTTSPISLSLIASPGDLVLDAISVYNEVPTSTQTNQETDVEGVINFAASTAAGLNPTPMSYTFTASDSAYAGMVVQAA